MRLLITKYEILQATEAVKCDACEMYWTWLRMHREYNAKMKEIKIMMKCVQGVIFLGNKYISYEFVDEETGEIFELNVRNDLDAVMIENSIYPPLINRAIRLFKN